MIDKLNHYSLTNPTSVYDEEAMTALELAGRTAAKVNECVEQVNGIPQKIAADVQEHIDGGEFDKQVDKYAGELRKEVQNVEARLASTQDSFERRIEGDLTALDSRMDNFTRLSSGSTTGDAELQDIRVWANGNTSESAGAAVRGQYSELRREVYQAPANFAYTGWENPMTFDIKLKCDGYDTVRINFNDTIGIFHRSGRYDISFTQEMLADIPSAFVEIASSSCASICIPNYQSLVYNVDDGLLHLRSPGTNLQTNDICLVKTGYAYPVGGTMIEEWLTRRMYDNSKRLTALESTEIGFVGDEHVKHYSRLVNNTSDVEKFIFFTDPHLCGGSGWESEFFNYMSAVKKYHDTAPVDFVICGGDWLTNSDTQEDACYKLGFIGAQMRKMFPRFYPAVGNHDTNYQGVNSEGTANSGELTHRTVSNLWGQGERKTNYYTFQGANTTFFVFDTDLDWTAADGIMTDYFTEQFNWFRSEAEKVTGNIALVFHIVQVTDSSPDMIHPLVTNVTSYASAFNARHSDAKIRFALCGHIHTDSTRTLNGIPVACTTHLRDGGTPSFDMCIANYETNTLKMVRVGTGEHRTVEI